MGAAQEKSVVVVVAIAIITFDVYMVSFTIRKKQSAKYQVIPREFVTGPVGESESEGWHDAAPKNKLLGNKTKDLNHLDLSCDNCFCSS